MAIEFITTRDLKDKTGQVTGKVRIMKLKEENEASVSYTCPECGYSEQRKELWEEPFLTGKGANKKMRFSCAKCGYNISVLKLKKEIAKDKKRKK
jgi:predicted RNA-binding Zn-ribbon protein involved in translation (DUF1610 family)